MVVVESQVLRLGLTNPNYEVVVWIERDGKVGSLPNNKTN